MILFIGKYKLVLFDLKSTSNIFHKIFSIFSYDRILKLKHFQIVLGRASSSSEVDIDLFAVKPDKRISRKQCVICHIKSNLFYVFNTGKLPLYVDGNPVLTNTRLRINEKSLIEVNRSFKLFGLAIV